MAHRPSSDSPRRASALTSSSWDGLERRMKGSTNDEYTEALRAQKSRYPCAS